MADPSWQDQLRLRLLERNSRESSYASVIEQYRRLVQQTKLLKERNASLLRAMGSVRTNPSSSTVYVPGTGEENPVRAAYIVSLESQISSLRDELASVYKTQNQNTQRLLSMTETLREKEEFSRIEAENMRKLQEEASILARKVEQHNELMVEKDRTAQILHDEINTLQLELGQIEERNAILVKDNAKLLQRWLDAKQEEVNKMNEVNEFYQDMRSKQERVPTEPAGPTGGGNGTPDQTNGKPARLSGNDQLNGTASTAKTTDGTTSSGENSLSLTPNG